MRFERLRLHPYGPFDDLELDLTASAGRVLLLPGLNEAGKSTLVRACKRFLFGFPHRNEDVADAWRFKAAELRVSATLLGAGGERVVGTRRKGKADRSFVGEQDAPLDDAPLQRLLRGLSEERMDRQFFLGHDLLRTGGRALLADERDAGAVFYAAGLGLDAVALREVLAGLERDAEALFKKGGQNPQLNVRLSRLAALKEQIAQRTGSAEALAAAEEGLGRRRRTVLAAEDAAARAERACADAERRVRIRRALSELPALREQWEQVRAFEPLPADYNVGERKALSERLHDLRARRGRAEELLGEARQKLDAQAYDPTWAEAFEPLKALNERRAARRQDGLGAEEASKAAAAAERAFAESLGAAGLERAAYEAVWHPSPAEAQAVRAAAERVRGGEGKLAERRRVATEAEQALSAWAATARPVVEEAAGGADATLADALTRFVSKCESLCDALAGAAGKRVQLTAELRRTLGGRAEAPAPALETFAAQRTPPRERLEVAASHAQRTLEAEQRATAELQRLSSEIARLEVERQDLITAGGAHTEEELRAARDRRDGLLSAEPVDVRALREAIAAADRIVDALRQHADRAARRHEIELRIDMLGIERTAAEQAVARAAEARHTAEVELAAADADVPPPPGATPAERAQRLGALAELQRRVAAHLESEAELAERRDGLRALAPELAAADLVLPPDARCEVWGEAARRALDRLRKILQEREQRAQAAAADERESKTLQKAQKAAKAALEEAERSHAEARAALDAERARLGLPEGAAPHDVLARLDRLAEAAQQAAAARKGADEASVYRRRCEAYDAEVAALWTNLWEGAVPPADDDRAWREALERARQAALARAGHDRAKAEVERQERELEERDGELAGAHGRLLALVDRVGVAEPDDLPGREADHARRAAVEADLAELKRRLVGEGEPDLEAAEAFLAGATLPDLEQAAAIAATQRDAAKREAGEARQALGAAETEVRALLVETGCEGAAEEAQRVLAESRALAARYLELRGAARLLRGTMDRHRREIQGPLLRQAGERFARLTAGAFIGLDVEEDADGEPRIVAVSPDRRGVPPGGLSDGTVDQLYLAVVLAYLDRHLDAHGPVPVILDDAFVHFDDARAARAFAELGRVAARTQILYFTHHPHLRDVAAAALPGALAELPLTGARTARLAARPVDPPAGAKKP